MAPDFLITIISGTPLSPFCSMPRALSASLRFAANLLGAGHEPE